MKRTFFLKTALLAALMTALVSTDVMAVPQPVGTVQRDTILGVPCMVYLPHNYESRVKKEFPCLYLQHGMFGSEDDWTKQGQLMLWMDSLLREEMVEEMVIIMPDNFLGSIPPAERKALMDAPNVTPDGKPFDTEKGAAHWKKLTRLQEQSYEMSGYWEEHFPEFMNEVENKYRVATNSKCRAIAGLSMGGFHTMHVSHYMFGTFDYIGLFSPVILPRVAPDLTGDGKGMSEEEYAKWLEAQAPYKTGGFKEQLHYASPVYNGWQNDVRQMAQLPPLYWIAIGREDFLYVQLQDYRRWLESNNFEYTYYESDGGHTWPNWQDYLCRFLKACFTRIW